MKGIDISDYKFGAYLSYSSDNTIPSNSIVFNCVKNDKFKFICVNIELKIIENDITEEDINRYLLYTINDLTLGGDIIDTRIPFRIDFIGSTPEIDSDPDTPFIIKASIISINNGTAKFTEFVKRNSIGEYSWIYFTVTGDTYAVKVIDVIDDTSILVSGHPWKFDPSIPAPIDALNNRLDPQFMSLVAETGPFDYSQGGKNEFANLLDSISAYKYSKRFNSFGQVNYITIPADGTLATENDFVLSVESGVDVVKPSIIQPTSDPERPKAFRLSSNQIGNIVEDRKDGGYVSILRRMNGDYNPIFNDIITFSDINSDKKVDGEDPIVPTTVLKESVLIA